MNQQVSGPNDSRCRRIGPLNPAVFLPGSFYERSCHSESTAILSARRDRSADSNAGIVGCFFKPRPINRPSPLENPDQHSAAQALASLGFKSQTLALAKVSWFGGGFTGTQSLGLVGHCQMVVLLISEILATAPAILKLTTL